MLKVNVGDIFRDRTDGEEVTVVSVKNGIIQCKVTLARHFAAGGIIDSSIREWESSTNWYHIPIKETRIRAILREIDEHM